MSTSTPQAGYAPIVAVKDGLITIDISDIAIKKNEVGYVHVGDERLKAEVLRIRGNVADMQVFEETTGVKIGDQVEMSGDMLTATLGPGLLGQVFDGLQVPLDGLAEQHGYFLPRGQSISSIDAEQRWWFEPQVAVGDSVVAGQVLGATQEGPYEHRIMVPFDLLGCAEVTSIESGEHTVADTVVTLRLEDGSTKDVSMLQKWPVRRTVSEQMLKQRHATRLFPDEPITTGQRIIDTFLPLARGGTGCIPGPFGAGKTVLQGCIARYSTVDIVIIIACGERAGEVVETITEYPELKDPRTGGTLMQRAIIIANTSSMPVAAREASIYTGVTLGEYYQQMGYNVLCIADSTSRWAQALRETSGRMEEIPGEEAFPAYLDSTIKSVYERAGVIQNPNGGTGSLTLVGTVSPAGGNFEEPVTQATLGTVKCFLGLSSERAYKRYYPAIDILISWSRYLDQLEGWFAENMGPEWVGDVKRFRDLLEKGESVNQMMQVAGEEGITLEDFVVHQKAQLLDMCFLQQDAFDDIDAVTPQDRLMETFSFLRELLDTNYVFEDKDEVRSYFTKMTSMYKNWNYAAGDSDDYHSLLASMRGLSRKQAGLEASEA